MKAWAVLTPTLRCQVGEGPLWVSEENALYWIDIVSPAVHRMGLHDRTMQSWPMPEMIGFIQATRQSRQFVIGLASGLAKLTLDPLTITTLHNLEPDRPANRINDATTDAAGRLWIGTMLPDGSTSTGALYRYDSRHGSARIDDGYFIPNGPVFSDDGTFYIADSSKRLIYRFDPELGEGLGNKQIHIRFEEEDWGLPDGMAIDVEGCLWVAHWDGARLSRFDPDGSLIHHTPLPVSRITSCAFGGVDLGRLFVTTAAAGREAELLSGAVLEVDPKVKGLRKSIFGG
jgi:xylono-1,5-lactonase